MNALHMIRNLLQQWISTSLSLEGVSAKALKQHQAIFLTIAKKNGAAARGAMQKHLGEMATSLLLAQEKHRAESTTLNRRFRSANLARA